MYTVYVLVTCVSHLVYRYSAGAINFLLRNYMEMIIVHFSWRILERKKCLDFQSLHILIIIIYFKTIYIYNIYSHNCIIFKKMFSKAICVIH